MTGHKTWTQLRRYTNIKPADVHKTVADIAAAAVAAEAAAAAAAEREQKSAKFVPLKGKPKGA